MITIDETISEEKSIFKKKINRKTTFNVKEERKQLIKSNKNSKMPKQKSIQSIKQRSLDDIHLKKNQIGLKFINKNEKNGKKKEKTKNIKRELKDNQKLNSMYKLVKKEGYLTKQQKQKKSPKNKQLKFNNKNQMKPLKITSRTRSQESIQKLNPKYKLLEVQQSTIDKHNLNFTGEGENTTNNKIKTNNSSMQLMRHRNITLNQQIFRVFQQTESKIVQQESITHKQFQQLQSYYNCLCELSRLDENRFNLIIQMVKLSNSMNKSVKNLKVWKWYYLTILVIGLIKDIDQQSTQNIKNLLAYLKINFILYVQNILMPIKIKDQKLNQKIKQFLQRNNKKITKDSERLKKIYKNIDIIKSIICLIISMTQLQPLFLQLIDQVQQISFLKKFFDIWRKNNYHPYLPPIDPQFSYTLCLDLDETMIFYDQNQKKLLIRPYATQFLTKVSKDFQLIIFTSSLKEYADFMIKELDPKNLISYRLYRQNCTIINNKQRKDLSKLGRDLSKTFIIDNLTENYELQPESGFTISSWYGKADDRGLIQVLSKLYQVIEQKK